MSDMTRLPSSTPRPVSSAKPANRPGGGRPTTSCTAGRLTASATPYSSRRTPTASSMSPGTESNSVPLRSKRMMERRKASLVDAVRAPHVELVDQAPLLDHHPQELGVALLLAEPGEVARPRFRLHGLEEAQVKLGDVRAVEGGDDGLPAEGAGALAEDEQRASRVAAQVLGAQARLRARTPDLAVDQRDGDARDVGHPASAESDHRRRPVRFEEGPSLVVHSALSSLQASCRTILRVPRPGAPRNREGASAPLTYSGLVADSRGTGPEGP